MHKASLFYRLQVSALLVWGLALVEVPARGAEDAWRSDNFPASQEIIPLVLAEISQTPTTASPGASGVAFAYKLVSRSAYDRLCDLVFRVTRHSDDELATLTEKYYMTNRRIAAGEVVAVQVKFANLPSNDPAWTIDPGSHRVFMACLRPTAAQWPDTLPARSASTYCQPEKDPQHCGNTCLGHRLAEFPRPDAADHSVLACKNLDDLWLEHAPLPAALRALGPR